MTENIEFTNAAEQLAANGILAEMNNNSIFIDPKDIVVDEEQNTRTNGVGDVSDLVESMSGPEGQIEPVVVFSAADGTLHLIAGFRRHAAALKIQKKNPDFKLKAEVREIATEDVAKERLRINVAENVKRSNLSPIELAAALQKLVDAGYTKKEAGKITGISTAYVSQLTAITTKLPEHVQTAVHTGDLEVQTAYQLTMLPAEEVQDRYEQLRRHADGAGRKKITRADLAAVNNAAVESGSTEEGDGESGSGSNSAKVTVKPLTAKQYFAAVAEIRLKFEDESIPENKRVPAKVMEVLELTEKFLKCKTKLPAYITKLRQIVEPAE